MSARAPALTLAVTCSAWPRPVSPRCRARAGSRRWPRTPPSHPKRSGSCILLWMNGGPSQMDTFDLKPGHANGGPYKAIETAVPGLRISEHLPKLARQMQDVVAGPLDEHQGRRPRPRHLPPADRLHAAGADPVPRARRRWWPRSWRSEDARAAELRQHRARSAPSTRPRTGPGSSATSTPRWSSASRCLGRIAAGRTTRRRSKVQDLALPAGIDLKRSDARLGLLDGLNADFIAEHPGETPAEPAHGVRAGREADALGQRQGVRPRRRARPPPRRLRPQPVRPGLPARPPAGRARGAVRRGDALGRRRQPGRSAGTRTSRTSRASRSSARCSTPAGRR